MGLRRAKTMNNQLPARPGIKTIQNMRERIETLTNLVNERDTQIEKFHTERIEILNVLSPEYCNLPLKKAVITNLEDLSVRATTSATRAQEVEEQNKKLDKQFSELNNDLEKVIKSSNLWRRSFYTLGWIYTIITPFLIIGGYMLAIYYGGR